MRHWVKAAMLGLLTSFFLLPVQAADDAMFTDLANGEPKQVEDYTGGGKWLVVMFWAHDCHICNQEAESYAQFHVENKDSDARVLGVSLDGAEKKADAEEFVERHGLPFPNLIGEPGTTMLYYSMRTRESFRGTPTFLLFDPTGKLRAAQAGAVPVASLEAYIERQSQKETG